MFRQIVTILQCVAAKEGLDAPVAFLKRVAESSDRNLRRALLQFESSKVAK